MTHTIDTPTRTKQAAGFTAVSGAAAMTNAVVLWLMLVALDSAAVATALAALVVAPPTLVAYQRVVWPTSGSNRWTQHLVFLANTGGNVLVASAVAALAERSGAGNTVVFAAVVTTYGVLAVARFALLDRVLFAEPAAGEEAGLAGSGSRSTVPRSTTTAGHRQFVQRPR